MLKAIAAEGKRPTDADLFHSLEDNQRVELFTYRTQLIRKQIPLVLVLMFKHDPDVSRGTTWRWLVTNCPRGVEKHRWFAYFSQLAQGVLLNVHVVKGNQHSPYFDRGGSGTARFSGILV